MKSVIKAPVARLVGFNKLTVYTGNYGCFMMFGLLQMVGIINIMVKVEAGGISVINFLNGQSYSNSNLTFSYSSDYVTVTASNGFSGMLIPSNPQ